MPLLRIHLLGGFLLEHDARPLPPIPSAVARSLFAYLATYRNRRHTRDLLAGTFWPDQSEPSARKRLSQTLWQINTALEEVAAPTPLIEVTPGDIAFSPTAEFWLDTADFEHHLGLAASGGASEPAQIAALEAAVDAYRGDFLAGFYDDWTLIERERYREQYLAALERLTALHKGRADYPTAVSYARRLTLHDPLRESAHREVMRLCFLLGRANEALQQYDRCVAILSEELGAEPAMETRELRTQIAELRDKGDRPFAPTLESPLLQSDRSIPLVGRTSERVAVVRRLEETLVGHGGAVLIEGDGGIGKTRLLQELTEDAQWRGLSVLWAECFEDETLHPFNTVRRALEMGLTPLRLRQLGEILDGPSLGELARVVPRIRSWFPDLPALPQLHPDEGRDRLHQALHRTLTALGELNPHVIFFDDLQWSDEESVAILTELAADLEASSILFCLSYRTTEARERPDLWAHLRAIDGLAPSERVVLSSLTQDESTRLIEESLGVSAVPTDVADGLFFETGGNPLFLLETLRTWHEEARELVTTEAESEVGALRIASSVGFPVSGGVAQVIARRFASLDAPVRATLEGAAVLGRVSDPATVAQISGLSKLETLQALDTLVQRGAVVEADDAYEFAHYQMRRVALDGIDPADLGELHRRAGDTLEARNPERVEDLARHFAAAGIADKAARYSLDAGRRAASLGAFDTATQHLERAGGWMERASLPSQEHFDALGDWEAVLDVLGQRDGQRDVIADMERIAGGDARMLAETWRRRALHLAHAGSHVEAMAAAATARSLIEGGTDAARRGSVLHTYGKVLSHAGRPAEAIPWLEAAVDAFSGDATAEAEVGCDLGSVLCESQHYQRATHELARALDRYRGSKNQRGVAEATGRLATVHLEQGDLPTATEFYEIALSSCRDIGYRRGEAVNLSNLSNALYLQGRVGDSLRTYEAAAAVFGAIGDRRGAAHVLANAASVRYSILGDPTAADDAETALGYYRSEEHSWGEAFCHEILAGIAHREGRFVTARRHVETGLDLLAGIGHRWLEAHLLRLAAQISLDEGHPEDARKLIEGATTICVDLGLDDVAPTVQSVAALTALAMGQAPRALTIARSASANLSPGVEQSHLVWYRHHLVATAVGVEAEAESSIAEAHTILRRIIDSLDVEQREMALGMVPEHAAIVTAYSRVQSHDVRVMIPRSGVPLGRALRSDDWIEVCWTISTPEDLAIEAPASRRRHRLLRLAAEAHDQGGAPRVEDLAEVLGVSGVTIRRDLTVLRRDGHRVPTRGRRG
jgi:DNA-binding SARP family transcriptional activator